MISWLGFRGTGPLAALGALTILTGCPDDGIINPFVATEGGSSGSGGSTGSPDDGSDDGMSVSADGTTTSGASSSTGMPTTAATLDDSSGGSTMGVVDTGDSGDSSSDGGSSDGGSSSSTGEPVNNHVPCPVGELSNLVLPSSVSDNSSQQMSDFGGSCGGAGAPDMGFTFTAPSDGSYTFDTAGSTIDTVMYVLDGTCAGAELVCDDDGLPGTTQSMASVDLVQDQTVTVVVDGFGLAGGNFTVSVREGSVTCPVDLGNTVPQTVAGQNVVATDEFSISCGSAGSADTGFAFTAPADGTYTFEISGNTFDTIMAVLDGECTGPELGCNDDLVGAVGGASGLFVGLTAGQTVTIVVEGDFGATGNFDLSIGMLAGDCPDEDLGSMGIPFVVNGSTTAEDNATAGTCGGLASPDWAYTWTAPADATYGFSTAGTAFDTVVYVLDGTCTGPQLSCSNDSQGMATSNAIATLTSGQTVVIVVDGFGEEGDFTLTVDETLDSGNCCFSHPTTGCDDPNVTDCVCNTVGDTFCCNNSWDGICVSEAINQCNAVCL